MPSNTVMIQTVTRDQKTGRPVNECRLCWRLFTAIRDDEAVCPHCAADEASRTAARNIAAQRRRKRGHS